MIRRLALQQVVSWKRLVITSFSSHFTYWKAFFQVFFDIELLPMSSSPSFYVYGENEISFLAEQFFSEKSVKIIMTEWEESKFELIAKGKPYR